MDDGPRGADRYTLYIWVQTAPKLEDAGFGLYLGFFLFSFTTFFSLFEMRSV